MNAKNLMPSRRRLTFSLIILSLIAFFFIGYYFYYIPSNRIIQHKNGFLILENIQQNIKDRNEYLQTSFINILRARKNGGPPTSIGQLQKQLDNYKIGGKILANQNIAAHLTGNVSYTATNAAVSDAEDSAVYLARVSNDSLFYRPINFKKTSYQIYVPSKNFMEPLLSYQKNELFESYLLIGGRPGLIYTDAGLALDSRIAEDSLIANNHKALFAGIRDITIRGIDYKMFYYPFQLGAEHVQLGGFVKADTYFNKLRQVPVTFIYPIVIALLLIIMLLPIVKFYLMGKDEHVKYADFILGMISFFAGTAMLTLIILQVLLLWGANIRTKDNLGKLSKQIEGSFTQELTRAYLQLDSLDFAIKNSPDSMPVRQMREHKNYNVSGLIKKYFERHENDTAAYYNFNRVAWIDTEGSQRLKGEIDTSEPVFTNVAARNYFQILKNNEGYSLPGYPAARYGMEPVNSWTNGGFSIIISMKSRLGNGSIATLSVQMASVTQTILPPGFGFCIIDNDGKVMLHSDMNRNLQENFIAKTEPSRQIKEAVKSRQESFFSALNLYGKNNALYIKPVAALPFHLAVFYDKGYIVPINMRILTFSLLFCFISFAICLLLWLGVFRKRYPGNSFLHGPVFKLNWVAPKEKMSEFYIPGIFFLFAYLLFQVIMIFSFKYFEVSNYAVLILVILSPINIFSGLFVINYRVKRNNYPEQGARKRANPNKAMTVLVLQPVIVFVAYWYSSSTGYAIQSAFLFFEIFFFIFLCLFFWWPKVPFHFLYKPSASYLSLYAMFATLLLLCLSVLPASLFTWYAHNQEITQSVKKEQLYLANALQERAGQNRLFNLKRNSLKPPADYFKKLQYQWGIYKIYDDSISPNAYQPTGGKQKKSYENFYFSVANDIGNNYYDPLLMPALKDTATGNAWYWSPTKDALSFWYTLYYNPDTALTVEGSTGKALQITSAFPPRYLFVDYSLRGMLLLLFVAWFIYGLYLLLRFISGQLFLRKFIPPGQDHHTHPANGIAVLFEEYKCYQEEWGTSTGLVQSSDIDRLVDEYDIFKPVPDSTAMYKQERAMIAAQDKYRDFYFFIWDKCRPNEKYLLLDFAQNGFANFKNTEAIHHLLEKGIFIIQHEEVKLFSVSFGEFILAQSQHKDMIRLRKEFQQHSAWQTIRIPLLIILLGVAFFIFLTQEQAFQKITALVAGISTIFTLLLKFFSDGAGLFSSKK